MNPEFLVTDRFSDGLYKLNLATHAQLGGRVPDRCEIEAGPFQKLPWVGTLLFGIRIGEARYKADAIRYWMVTPNLGHRCASGPQHYQFPRHRAWFKDPAAICFTSTMQPVTSYFASSRMRA